MASVEAEASRDERSSAGGLVYDGFISYSHAADDLLAPRLQAGLQRFAKPWWKRRALRIFRDESSLSANPHLWSSITDALDGSGWFVLLLSPDAAQSEWVSNEVEYWLDHKNADKIIPVLTDGDFTWFDADFISDAAPPALQGAFSDEPRWVDLRFARSEDQLDLNNPTFSAAVADIASAIRGVPKDELESEEVLQHRRTTRTAWAAGLGLVALLVVAIGAAWVAVGERNEAKARALGASAVAALEAQSDPQLAKLLALEAIHTSGSIEDQPKAVVDTLFTALVDDRLVGTIDTGYGGYTGIALSTDGGRLAVASENGASVRLYTVPDGELLWEYQEPATADRFTQVHISPDGTKVAVSVEDSQGAVRLTEPDDRPNRIVVLDASNGSATTTVPFPDCSSAQVLGSGWSHDGSRFAVSNGWVPCARDGAADGFWVEVLDGTTFEPVTLLVSADPVGTWAYFAEGDELFVRGFVTETVVYRGPTYETAEPIEGVVGPGAVSADGSIMSAVDLNAPTNHALIETATGSRIDGVTAPAYPALGGGFIFSPDASRFIVETEGNQTVVWDVASGEQLFELPTGRGGNPAMSPDNTHLYTAHTDGTVKIWFLGPRSIGQTVIGDLGNYGFVNGNHFTLGPSLGATEVLDLAAMGGPTGAQVVFFDRETGLVTTDPVPGSGVFALSDGRFLILYWAEPQPDRYLPSRGASLHDPTSGETTDFYGCASLDPSVCFDQAANAWISVSTDRTEIMVRDADTPAAWEIVTADGTTVESGDAGQTWSWVSAFTPDWILGYGEFEVAYTAVDRATGELLFSLGVCGCREEVSPEGRYLATADGGRVTIVTLGSWETAAVQTKAGHVRGMAFNEDETLLALGDDRSIHIIDVEAQDVVQSIPTGGVSDFHWLDAETLLIGTSDGVWATVSLNVGLLVDLALDHPGRGFTERECSVYGIEPCPTTVDEVRERYGGIG